MEKTQTRPFEAALTLLVVVTSLAVASCCSGTSQGAGAAGAESPPAPAAEAAAPAPAQPPPPPPAPAPAPVASAEPACTAEALRPVVEGSESVAAGLSFELTGVHCAQGFARATLQPAGEGDAALTLFRAADGGWTLLDLGTGLECPIDDVPDDLCGELVGGEGETPSP